MYVVCTMGPESWVFERRESLKAESPTLNYVTSAGSSCMCRSSAPSRLCSLQVPAIYGVKNRHNHDDAAPLAIERAGT